MERFNCICICFYFNFFSHRYKHKLKQLKIRTIMKTLPDVGYPHARTVQETLENFISSADDVVKVEHVPERKYGKDRSHSYSHEYKSVS